MSLDELKSKLDGKSTEELQHAVMHNLLIEQALPLAKEILEERNATIPEAIPDETLEQIDNEKLRRSNKAFILTAIAVCVWAGYGILTGLFEPPFDSKRMERSVLILGLSIAPLWGWEFFGRGKKK